MIQVLIVFWLSLVTPTLYATTLLIVGDSLSAGYSMMAHQAWPSFLSQELKQRGYDVSVINASISGDTTANGLKRLPDLLSHHKPSIVLVELGGNDGLRGFPIKLIEKNLESMIKLVRESKAVPLLMQIKVPPNYGKRYSEAFSTIYARINEASDVRLLPFFLEKILLKEGYMLDDGLHPSIDAQPWIARFIADELVADDLLSWLNKATE